MLSMNRHETVEKPFLAPTTAECCTATGHAPSAGEGGVHSFMTVPYSAPFECYIAHPPDGKPARGFVLVVHDIFGLRSGRHMTICDELAEAGFVAACPDLFGDGLERAAAFNPDMRWSSLRRVGYILWNFNWMMKAFRLPWEEIAPKLRATLDHSIAQRQETIEACSAVGFCWGGSVVARLLSEEEASKFPVRLAGGIGFHPSHRGWDAANVAMPLRLAPAGDDPVTIQPGGQLAQPLVERFGASTNVPFPAMLHGWMTRGPLDDAAVARDYRLGMQQMISWLEGDFEGR